MGKQRIAEGTGRKFANCQMYREDIEELVTALTRDGTPPTIKADGFEFDTVDDLFAHIGTAGTKTLALDSVYPSVTVTTSEFSGAVSVGMYPTAAKTPDAVLSYHAAEIILERCSLRPSLLSRWWTGLVSWSVTIGLGIAAMQTKDAQVQHGLIAVAALTLLIVALFITYQPRKRTHFYGVSKRDKPTFWQRKRDDLMVQAITGTTGFVLGIVSTIVVQGLQAHK